MRDTDDRSDRSGVPSALERFHLDEAGTHALEALLVITFTVIPCCWALLLLEEVSSEFLGLEVLVLSSPFF
jgi:hypothetical protein